MTNLHLTSCTTADIAEANAHRVVAAPELVAELVAALADCVAGLEAYTKARGIYDDARVAAGRAAIARAEGAAP